jgi:hypothetical protein
MSEKLMKKILCLFLLVSLFFCGCKKNDSNPVITDPPKSLVVQNITGQLSKWIYGKSYTADFNGFASSQIDENGSFNITNLTSPSEDKLSNIVSYFDSAATKPSISDQSAKYCIVPYLSITKVKNPGKVYGIIQNVNASSSKDNYSVNYIYFDRAVTLNGTATFSFAHDSWTLTKKEIYNQVSFEKGWNKFVVKNGAYDNKTNTITCEILREEPSAGIWAYTDLQTIVTIQSGPLEAGLKFPLCVDNGYKRSAALYTASEINASGIISRLSWKALTRNGVSRPIKIYMKEVDATTISPGLLATFMSGATKVYDSSTPLLTDDWNWNEFVLMESFKYSGTKSLMVIVETNYGGSGVSDDCYFEYSTLNECKFITWSLNNSQTFGFGTTSFDRPNIKITFDPE